MDGELLLESQLTGGRQWPHCVRVPDLDFLPLSSPAWHHPGLIGRESTPRQWAGPGAGTRATGSPEAETCDWLSPPGRPGKVDTSQKSFPPPSAPSGVSGPELQALSWKGVARGGGVGG